MSAKTDRFDAKMLFLRNQDLERKLNKLREEARQEGLRATDPEEKARHLAEVARRKAEKNEIAARKRAEIEAKRKAAYIYKTRSHEASKRLRPFRGSLQGLRDKDPECKVTVEELEALWIKQKGICAISGLHLSFIDGQSWGRPHLDHIVPHSKGGKTEIANLQWAYGYANLAKRDLLMADHIFLCQATVDHQRKIRLNAG